MAVRKGDVDVTIDFDVQENVSGADSYGLVIRHKSTGTRREFTAQLNGTQIVRYTTTSADDLPLAGDWEVQAHVIGPSPKDRRSTLDTLPVQEAI